MIRRFTLALLLAGSTACTATVDLDYSFDVDPCGPRPLSCPPSGAGATWLVVNGGAARSDAEGRRAGFDLDGTAESICGQPDFLSPNGEPGIDDQLGFALETGERLSGRDFWAEQRALVVAGGETTAVFVDGLDGPNDDCVEVTLRLVVPSSSVTPADRDANGDGELDPNLTYDYSAPTLRAPTACVVDGVLHARFGDAEFEVAPGLRSVVRHARLRATLDPERIDDALVGAGFPVSEIERLRPDLTAFVQNAADLDPSARDAADCTNASFALQWQLVPMTRGELR